MLTEVFTLWLSLRASLVAQMVKNPPAMQETWVQSLGWEDPLEEGMQRDPPFVPSKRLPDWASLELSPSVESCGCGLGPSPVRLG